MGQHFGLVDSLAYPGQEKPPGINRLTVSAGGQVAHVRLMKSSFCGLRQHWRAILILLLLPVLANGLVLLGVVNPDPAIAMSGLAKNLVAPVFPGGGPGWFDGAAGSISQSLALLSAHDWQQGIVPWWNPFTGPGMPLAAEMAGFSFFLPFLFLFMLHNGFIIFRVVLQIISGLAIYGLLVGLRLDRLAALTGAALFALNATFFVAPQAIGPVPFLPLLLLGVESATRRARGERNLGWLFIPFSIAYSFYGGFPEVAFFDSLFAAAWIVWRAAGLPGTSRLRFLSHITLQTMLGIMMALPLLIPFLSYVSISALGAHESYFSHSAVPMLFAPVVLFPFVYGELNVVTFSNPALHIFHALYDFGGWFGLPAVFLAVAAVIRPGQHRGLVFFLSGFVAVFLLRCAGFTPFILLLNIIPFVAKTSITRFCWPSLDAAVFILTSLYLDTWIRSGANTRRASMLINGLMSLLCLGLLALAVKYLNDIHFAPGPAQMVFAATFCLASILDCVAISLLIRQAPTRIKIRVVVGLMIGQTLLTFFTLQLPAPRSATFDLGGVNYLQKNIGLGRIFSLEAFNWDYPAAYGVSAINSFALPVDKRWTDYIQTRLDPNANAIVFNGYPTETPGSDPTRAMNQHFPEYLALGLKYVLTPSRVFPFEIRNPLPLRDETARTISLDAGQSVSGSIPGSLIGLPTISSVDVKIGTFFGDATGMMTLKICADDACVSGAIDLAKVGDDQFDKFVLDQPLMVNPKTILHYQFTHVTGRPATIWIYAFDGVAPANLQVGQEKTGISPWFHFDLTNPKVISQLVFHDDLMDIYQVAGGAPFYSTSAPCKLSQEDLNKVTADCPAPATLTRLEAWYPGWHVRVNGVTHEPRLADGLFQSTPIPEGRSFIRFFYIPVGTEWSVGLACLALLIWLLQIFSAVRRAERSE